MGLALLYMRSSRGKTIWRRKNDTSRDDKTSAHDTVGTNDPRDKDSRFAQSRVCSLDFKFSSLAMSPRGSESSVSVASRVPRHRDACSTLG